MKWARESNFELFKIQVLGPRHSVVVCEASAAKQILLSTKDFARSGQFQFLTEGLLDHALFVLPTGDSHKRHRKLIQPGFGPVHLASAARVSVKKMQELFRVWDEKHPSQKSFESNMYKTFATVAVDVISLVAFGHDLKSVSKLSVEEEAKWDALEVLTGASLSLRAILPRFLWSLVGVASKSPQIAAARDEIHGLLGTLANERRQKLANSQAVESKWGMDVMTRLLKGGEDGSFTQEEIQGELLGFFLAGHETSSNTLTFACLELCQNQDIQEKLYNEVKSINLDDESLENPAELLTSLKYLDAIFKEVQRLHSIVGSVGRTVISDNVEVGGKLFPKGTVMQVYIRAIHLNPRYYKDPNLFNPQRWLDKEVVEPGAFLPFSDGPHNCIGRKMAEIEIKIILVELVQRFKLDLAPNAKIELYTTITHGLKEGLACSLTKRS